MPRRPVRKLANVWTRKLHRWGAITIALPLLVVITSGILLQLKKEWSWIQPPTLRADSPALLLSFDEILAAAIAVPQAGWSSWDDIYRLDVRPDKGIVKVRGNNRWEVQLDTATGQVLQSTYRRSDLIESFHDGSWFHDRAKLWVFLPMGFILACLWVTGVYLWILPLSAKRNGRKRRATQST